MKRLVLDQFTHFAFAAAAIVIVVLGALLYRINIRSADSTGWVSHTLAAVRLVGEINAQIGLAESAYRGYIIAPTEDFSADRDRAFTKVGAAVSEFKDLTSDNPEQRSRSARLEKLLAARFSTMRGSRLWRNGKQAGSASCLPIATCLR